MVQAMDSYCLRILGHISVGSFGVQEEGASSVDFFKCLPPWFVGDCLVLCHCEGCLPSVLACVWITFHKDSSQDG